MKKVTKLVLAAVLLTCFALAAAGCDWTWTKKKPTVYKIEFIVENEVYDTVETAGNEEIKLPTTPGAVYGNFIGWYINGNISTPFDASVYKTSALTSDLRVYAKFNYNLTYEYGSGTHKVAYVSGAAITPWSPPARDDLAFYYWYETDETQPYTDVMPARNLILRAKWGAFDQYPVRFYAENKLVSTYMTSGRETIPLPNLQATADSGEFVGWYYDEDVWTVPFYGTEYVSARLTKAVNVYAKFDYYLKYASEGEIVAQNSYAVGAATTSISYIPYSYRHVFEYWYEADGPDTVPYQFGTAMPSHNVTLNAKYSAQDMIIINQIYGVADKTDAMGSHSFIELYNPNDVAVSIAGWSVQAASSGTEWQMIELFGSIPARTSFLIRLTDYANTGMADPANLRITEADLNWSGITLQNKSVKVVLMTNTEVLTVENPFNIDGEGAKAYGYIDMLAAKGTGKNDSIDAFEGAAAPSGQSKQKALRRIDFADTDDNAVDAEFIDWSSADVGKYRPRSLADGAWTEIFDTPPYSITAGILPIIYITTDGNVPIPPKTSDADNDDYTLSSFKFVEDEYVYFDGKVGGIRVRGNTTASRAKKPYRIKFDTKTSFFGSEAFKSWVLLASALDAAVVRDYAALSLAEKLETQSTGRIGYHVEVFINGVYQGIYMLTDQIQEQRLGIEMDEDEIAEGGSMYEPTFDPADRSDFAFLVELDATAADPFAQNPSTGAFYFNYYNAATYDATFTLSTMNGYVVAKVAYPSIDEHGLTETQFKYIYSYVQYIDYLMRHPYDPEVWAKLNELVDMDSFIDYYLIQEWLMNCDVYGKSVFMSKSADGKLKMGPVWDIDWSVGGPFDMFVAEYKGSTNPGLWSYNSVVNPSESPDNASYTWISTRNWFAKMLEFEDFRTLMKARWENLLHDVFEEHIVFLQEYQAHIMDAALANETLWFNTLTGLNLDELTEGNKLTFVNHYAYMINFLTQRLLVMNDMIMDTENYFSWIKNAYIDYRSTDWQATSGVVAGWTQIDVNVWDGTDPYHTYDNAVEAFLEWGADHYRDHLA